MPASLWTPREMDRQLAQAAEDVRQISDLAEFGRMWAKNGHQCPNCRGFWSTLDQSKPMLNFEG